MSIRRTGAFALVLALTVIVRAQDVPCGKERWAVKDLSDGASASIDTKATNTTIAKLIAVPAIVAGRNDARHPEEMHLYRVKCRIAKFKLESDSDVHLVIEDPDDPSIHMIAEIPDPRCPDAIEGGHSEEFRAARAALEDVIAPRHISKRMQALVPAPLVYITGVSFFDPPHGQTGKADNNMELHPVVKIEN
jgi:hypothetical protein